MARKTKTQLEIISGIHCVKEALRAEKRRFLEIYVSRPLPESIAAIVRGKSIPVLQKASSELDKIAGTDHHQQVSAKVAPLPTISLSDMVKKNSSGNAAPLYLVIDSVEDPRNLGALIRTAICAGISGIVIPKDRSAPLTPAVSRASAGAMEHSEICRVTNLVNAIKEMKTNGIWFTGLDRKGRLSLYDVDMTGPHAIVIGGENTGIRQLVSQHCDNLCHIPQSGPINSLNASVAGSVAIYEAVRQRENV